jgi:hypothetical protein
MLDSLIGRLDLTESVAQPATSSFEVTGNYSLCSYTRLSQLSSLLKLVVAYERCVGGWINHPRLRAPTRCEQKHINQPHPITTATLAVVIIL